MDGRHAREARELVDHPLELSHLADDGLGPLLDGLAGVGSSLRNLRAMRSAESWIGVSGFLISCAMRRAASFQAASFCACMSCVESSSASTQPAPLPRRAAESSR